MELPPQSFSVIVGADGKVAKCVGNIVMDRSVGNSAGLGGMFYLWMHTYLPFSAHLLCIPIRPIPYLHMTPLPIPFSSYEPPHAPTNQNKTKNKAGLRNKSSTPSLPPSPFHRTTLPQKKHRAVRRGRRAGAAGLGLQAHPAAESLPGASSWVFGCCYVRLSVSISIYLYMYISIYLYICVCISIYLYMYILYTPPPHRGSSRCVDQTNRKATPPQNNQPHVHVPGAIREPRLHINIRNTYINTCSCHARHACHPRHTGLLRPPLQALHRRAPRLLALTRAGHDRCVNQRTYISHICMSIFIYTYTSCIYA